MIIWWRNFVKWPQYFMSSWRAFIIGYEHAFYVIAKNYEEYKKDKNYEQYS